ncbi:MAG: ShlB/FhaC/HecB family hemolysin secretion/activation protein [Chromatiales bacterium]|nr:ShlB/FhaC/HecB family hemolysin secretion/activation protein [Chromatiales bacterium]
MKRCLYALPGANLKTGLLLAGCALLAAQAIQAQVPPSPGEIQRGIEDLRDFYRLERELRDPPPGPEIDRPEPPPPAELPPAADQEVFISRVMVDESAVLEAGEIRAAVASLEGRMATLAELFAAVERINELYAARRCVTCRAFLPAQDVREGVVRIELVEARIGQVRLADPRHTRRSYYEQRLTLAPGQLFRIERLEADLIRLNAIGQARARAELAAGEQFGTVDVIIEPVEPTRWQGLIFADNAGRDTVGEYRAGATILNNGLFGRSDPLQVSVTGARGTLGYSVSYNTPLNTVGTRLTALYDRSDIDVKRGPFADLDVGGYAYTAGLNLVHPLRITAGSRLQAFVGAYAKRSDTEFGSETLLSTRLRTLVWGIDWLLVGDHGVLFTSHAFTSGQETTADDRGFFKYSGDISWQRPFANDWFTLLRVAGQWSDRNVIPSQEQFQVGGTANVRGYDEGLLIGDSGYFISGEIQAPLRVFGEAESGRSDLRALLFVDHGAAFPFRPPGSGARSSDDYLTSIGVGLNLSWRSRVTGRAALGVPLDDPFDNQSSVRLHVYLQAAF